MKIDNKNDIYKYTPDEIYDYICELKEELQKADSLTQSCIFDGKEESQLNFRKAINIIKELRSWLEESKKIAVAQEHKGSINAINLVLDKLNELEGDKNDK